MRKDEIDPELKELAYDFFYWYSRFECALKENSFLKSNTPGDNADPCWNKFIVTYNKNFTHSSSTIKIINLHPKRQKISAIGKIEWKDVGVEHCRNELEKTITMIKTVRNNLFHGGKSGDREVDDVKRNKDLLKSCVSALAELAKLANFDDDFRRYY
ncbi:MULTISPECIES: hypothetical protein [unclassified Serratia (in: enterobacteria)]|uniref:hypothetical protein n=1 Tax=unclassified Serratia (in: enterobacteria) TaxID=2647522 RepID=UPI0015F4AAF9|nr:MULTISPECIES: hypothetical protein [unclassified Serratia (in: enterobacteria)]